MSHIFRVFWVFWLTIYPPCPPLSYLAWPPPRVKSDIIYACTFPNTLRGVASIHLPSIGYDKKLISLASRHIWNWFSKFTTHTALFFVKCKCPKGYKKYIKISTNCLWIDEIVILCLMRRDRRDGTNRKKNHKEFIFQRFIDLRYMRLLLLYPMQSWFIFLLKRLLGPLFIRFFSL